MEFLPAAAMLALIVKVVDFLRYARSRDMNGVTTQLIVWIAGVGVVLLVAQTLWADGISVGDRALSTLDIWSQVFAGLTIGSAASVVKDIGYKSWDNNNSAAIPTLLPNVGPRRHRRNRPTGTEDVG
jgi:hypothetical protein